MILPYIPQPYPKLLLFGGKGGVGKTTVSAATAAYLARQDKNLRVTVVSIDPAHSLGDVLGIELPSTLITIPNLTNLSAFHLNAQDCWRKFVQKHRNGISELLSDGIELDQADVERVLEFSIPGLDEIMAVLELEQLTRTGSVDVLVTDTAPAAHTMRLLALPDTLPLWLNFLDGLRDKQRYIASRFGSSRKGYADRFVEDLLNNLKRARTLLRDSSLCRFIAVMVPEAGVIEETERIINYMIKLRIPVTHVVVNRYRNSRSKQLVDGLQNRLPELKFIRYPLQAEEIIGVEKLSCFIESPCSDDSKIVQVKSVDKIHAARFPGLSSTVQIILVAGKGGVGKSTMAASIALAIHRHGKDKTLLYSTDPTHSLADVLGIQIEHNAIEVAGHPGFWAQQADPFRSLEELKKIPREEVEDLFENISREEHLDLPFERKALKAILDLVPPGLDEAMAIANLSDYMEKGEFKRFVIDTAPTGHLLRLLETPQLALQWLGFLLEIFVKRGLSLRMPRTTEMVLGLTHRLKKLNEVLTSSKTCHAVIVTTAEKVVLAETGRLAKGLEAIGIKPQTVVLNMVPASGDRSAIDQLHKTLPELYKSSKLLVVLLYAEELHGLNRLATLITY